MKHAAREWLARGEPAVMVEVLATQGSAPREAGTRMLVSAAHALGTIGGGHLELEAIDLARRSLPMGPGDDFEQRYALGPTLGQCCGGVVTLRFAALTESVLTRWPEQAPLFHLQLYGAGHVGRAIVRLLSTLPCSVQWIDEREHEFPSSWPQGWPPQVERLCVDAVEAEVANAPSGACYLVLTHRHDLDLRITEAILRRGDFRYFGLIGSKTKRERFIHRLQAQGVAQQAIDRMTCPIGVPGIEGKAPEVIAMAVVAQLLQTGGGPR
ncbi:xanthine dehydrogenase accessory protein XdhC [Schlegelella sp. S2-27]|uniref:Xanthine dehydrogenase accessory protein XdhC n=1 Tax=Caldimonas mangrovi TaxID=2944811 RepID=A0ABT0YUY6_9BURK|nr:xanthine dehydrogenase accessory protein XdhC [Caldimonas mangrovi]MCM5682571.1 xanthine dehydrogenase accessory protein XdhC [Caldimonas mangrovi]